MAKWKKYKIEPEGKWEQYKIRQPTFGQMPIGMPGYAKTEELIAKRPGALPALRKEVMQPWSAGYSPTQPFETSARMLTTGMKALRVPLERGEAALAGTMLQAQEEERKPEEATREFQKRVGQERRSAFMKGLKGERLAELGDIPRRLGWPEPISATIGFFSMIGIANLATKGKLIDSAKKGARFMRTKMPEKMGKNYLVDRAKLGSEGLDDLYKGLSQEYDELYGRIGHMQVNVKEVQNIVDELDPEISPCTYFGIMVKHLCPGACGSCVISATAHMETVEDTGRTRRTRFT